MRSSIALLAKVEHGYVNLTDGNNDARYDKHLRQSYGLLIRRVLGGVKRGGAKNWVL